MKTVHLGKAEQDDPIKTALKAPGTQRLTLEHDQPLTNFVSISTCAATHGAVQ